MNIIFIIILLVFLVEKITGSKRKDHSITDHAASKIDDPASVRLR